MLLSFSFDGIKKDFIIAERGKRRTAFAPIARNLITIPKMAGAYLQSTDTNVRVIEQPILIKGVDRFNVRKLEEEISAWLVTRDPRELIFDDEPDRVYYAVVNGEITIEDVVDRWGRGSVTFICPDPYKYKGNVETENFITNPTNVINQGTVETFPIFRASVLIPITNFDIILEDVYMRVGQPYLVEQTPAEPETKVYEDFMGNLTGWGAADYVDNGNISGEIAIWDESSFYPRLFGQVIEPDVWQGPSLKKSLPDPLQDFKVEALVELQNSTTQPGQTGMIEIYVLDAANNVLGKVGIEDRVAAASQSHFKARVGDAADGADFGNFTSDGWIPFKGILRIERTGTMWYAYISQVDDTTGNHTYQLGSKQNIFFEDKEGKWTAPVAQIQISFRLYPNTAPNNMYVHRVQVWRKNTIQATEVPFIAAVGDLIEIDHQTNDIRVNGESRNDLKDFGATFFPLDPGDNPIFFFPEDAATLNVEWREKYL